MALYLLDMTLAVIIYLVGSVLAQKWLFNLCPKKYSSTNDWEWALVLGNVCFVLSWLAVLCLGIYWIITETFKNGNDALDA